MSAQPYVGEITMFGGNFAPIGWMFCNGQEVSIADYETLFNLIGTTYGGDGQQTFKLPNLQGRFPVHMGTSVINGNSRTFVIGEAAGNETVTLVTTQIPVHTHPPLANAVGNTSSPTGAYWAGNSNTAAAQFETPPGTLGAMAANTVGQSGGNQPHENMSPYVCVSFIISLYGVYPTIS